MGLRRRVSQARHVSALLDAAGWSIVAYYPQHRRPCKMFQLLEDFYTQAIRIDLNAASQLAKLNPKDAKYGAPAERDAFVVTVLQGETHEGVYVTRLEQNFETFAAAKSFFDRLIAEYPDATGCDFTVPSVIEATDGSADRVIKP